MTDYKERIKINHDGSSNFLLFTKSGMLVATGYERVVFGGRGPYLEFRKDQIIRDNIYIPESCEWRLEDYQKDRIYYYEYRTNEDYVMVYLQNKIVDYADYKVDFVYISPFDLYDENEKVLIKKLTKN